MSMPATTTSPPPPSAPAGASTRPETPGRHGRPDPTADWPQLIRALAATDDDDLPVFGRFPA
jgi:hypothetical protein